MHTLDTLADIFMMWLHEPYTSHIYFTSTKVQLSDTNMDERWCVP